MTLDIDPLRAETPGVRHRAHLNNAGAALMPRPVLDAMTGHLGREAEIGGYEAAAEAAASLDGVYDSIALLIGARRDEIAVTENATVAWQMAFYALAVGFRRDDRILTSRAEYAANYVAYLQLARREGVMIDVIPDDAEGVLDPEALRAMLDERVRLIAITWENSYAARLGLKVAADYALALGLEAIEERCRALGDTLRQGLRRLPGITLHDLGPRPCAIVSFSVAGADPQAVKARCAAVGVNVSTSSPASTLLDATARSLPTVVRASPHYYNIEAELERLLDVVAAAR